MQTKKYTREISNGLQIAACDRKLDGATMITFPERWIV